MAANIIICGGKWQNHFKNMKCLHFNLLFVLEESIKIIKSTTTIFTPLGLRRLCQI